MSPESQLKQFIAKFEPKTQQLIRTLRQACRRSLPRANEFVYDNYNFFVIAYCPTDKVSDAYFSLGANAHGVNLFFGYNGSKLPDPHGILQGSGKLNRFVRIESGKHFASPSVQALVAASVELSNAHPGETAQRKLVIRSISDKQRPRRLDGALRKKSAPSGAHRTASAAEKPGPRRRSRNSRDK
jgi:hypothetical protein